MRKGRIRRGTVDWNKITPKTIIKNGTMKKNTTLRFRAAANRLGPLFIVITAAMYVYVWKKHPGLVDFLDHVFPYQLPLVVLHAAFAYAAAKNPEYGQASTSANSEGFPQIEGVQVADTDSDNSWADFSMPDDMFESPIFNPANGLPMVDSCIDIEGNLYGTDGG